MEPKRDDRNYHVEKKEEEEEEENGDEKLVLLVVKEGIIDRAENVWYLDTCASNHICSKMSCFVS